MRIALFQPDIPPNTGTIMRLCACMDAGLDIIEPCGFVLDDKKLKRAGMDYTGTADITRHRSWDAFSAALPADSRLLLFTTGGDTPYYDFAYQPNDILLFGSESAGAPDYVHDSADARLLVPMAAGMRSLNLAVTAAMALGEALRQTKWA